MVISTGAAIAQASQEEDSIGALPCPVSASVAHLKVNGTAMVAILAASSSHMVTQTRSFRSARSDGQMKGQSPTTVRVRLALPSAETSRFSPRTDRKWMSLIRKNCPAQDGPRERDRRTTLI